jgi:hypothetical protein
MGMRISATDAANHAIQVALNRDSEKLERKRPPSTVIALV